MSEHGHTVSTVDIRAELGELLIELADELRVHLMETVTALGLTLPQAMAMRLLDHPRAMRELADEMHYDASSITALVDRLEERGLVVRGPHPTDRRIKQVSLTPAGEVAQKTTEMRLCERLDLLDRLDNGQKRALRDLLATAMSRESI